MPKQAGPRRHWKKSKRRPRRRGRELERTFGAAGTLRTSGAEPACYGFVGFCVIADDAKRSGDGDGQDEAHAAPYPAPEEQRDGDSHGVELYLTANELRCDEILRNDVEGGEDDGDQGKVAHRFVLDDGQKKGRQPGEN